jgi:crotonobetainyl-CoA:carnitine CoA-transferase CaiB-like acyl-CoA transferase
VEVAAAAKTVQAHQEAQAVEPAPVVLMPVKQPAQATHHPQVPHRAILEQSVLVTAVVVEVVPDQQDPLVWAAAAQVQVATVAQVIPGWMV